MTNQNSGVAVRTTSVACDTSSRYICSIAAANGSS